MLHGKVMVLIFDENEAILNKIMAVLDDDPNITIRLPILPSVLSFPELTISPLQRQVLQGGIEIHLSYFEFETLICLAQQPGRVFTKEQIYRHVYQEEPTGEISNLIYCLIRSLRKKVEPDPRHPRYIATVRGVGYKFAMTSKK